jgi:hypothetical protein
MLLANNNLNIITTKYIIYQSIISGIQMISWAGEALETVSCCAFLKRRLIGAC